MRMGLFLLRLERIGLEDKPLARADIPSAGLLQCNTTPDNVCAALNSSDRKDV
jgi:hypothetical protein